MTRGVPEDYLNICLQRIAKLRINKFTKLELGKSLNFNVAKRNLSKLKT